MSKSEETRILSIQLVSVCLIGSVMLLEVYAGILTNSLAVLGDGIHAAYDFLITAILLMAYRISTKPADESHTYGHSRIKTLASFASGIALLYLVAQFMLRSVERFANPSPVYPGLIGILALAYTLAVDFARIILFKTSGIDDPSVKAGLFHSLADSFDTLVAILGFTLAGYFNIAYADAAAGLLLSFLMIYLSSKLLYETGLELTDAVPPTMVRSIRNIVEEEYGKVSQLNVRKLDKKTYVDIGISVPVEGSISSVQGSIKNVENRISSVIGGEAVLRVHILPKASEGIRDLIKDLALKVKGVLNVHNILVSQIGRWLLVSLHIEVPEGMSLTEAHRIADEVEENVLKNLENVGSVMVHMETAGSDIIPIGTLDSDSSLYFRVKEVIENEVKRFRNISRIGKIRVFREASGLNRIELTVKMEGRRSIAEAHEIASRLEGYIKRSFDENIEVIIHTEPEDVQVKNFYPP